MSSSPLLIDSSSSSSPPTSSQNVSSSPFPPGTTKFLYSSLHRVDNLVRRYQTLRTESNSQANLLSHISTRLSLLVRSALGPSAQTIDYIFCPPLQKLSLADRMAISLKENFDTCMLELDSSLGEMELVYMNLDDILVTLCKLVNSTGGRNGEWVRGSKHVQQVYLTLVTEVRGTPTFVLCVSCVDDEHAEIYGIGLPRMRKESRLCQPVHWQISC